MNLHATEGSVSQELHIFEFAELIFEGDSYLDYVPMVMLGEDEDWEPNGPGFITSSSTGIHENPQCIRLMDTPGMPGSRIDMTAGRWDVRDDNPTRNANRLEPNSIWNLEGDAIIQFKFDSTPSWEVTFQAWIDDDRIIVNGGETTAFEARIIDHTGIWKRIIVASLVVAVQPWPT